jgi:hypothetical protein
MMAILLITGGLRAADQSKTLFSDVQKIVFLKKGEPKKNQIIISDPVKIKKLMDALQLERNDLLVCDMAWQVTFIEKAATVETWVCKGCVEIHHKNASQRERFKSPPEFDKLVEHIEEWR